MHYVTMPIFHQVDIERFWRNIHIGEKHECWPWKNSQFTGGYGQFKIDRKNLKSHRVAYYLHYGIDPQSNLICHRCDNPVCCNPYHLFMGTEKDNMQDCLSKGRIVSGRGESHGSKTHPERWARGERVSSSKLTLDQVKEIRSLYAAGNITQDELSEQFGITRRGIGRIIKGDTWKHAVSENEPLSLSDPKRRGKVGETSKQAKLTEANVREIRALYAKGNTTYDELAHQYGVSGGAIRFIVIRRTWTHID